VLSSLMPEEPAGARDRRPAEPPHRR